MMGWFSAVIESRTLRGWAIVAIVGAIATVTMLALAGPSFAWHEDIDSVANKEVNKKLNELRKATDKYRVLSFSEGELPETIVDPDDATNVYVRPSAACKSSELTALAGPPWATTTSTGPTSTVILATIRTLQSASKAIT